MKKIYSKIIVTILVALTFSCSDDNSIEPDVVSRPESITAIRKVEVVDNLKFGETSIKAVVISDHSHGNFQGEILAVQQEGQPAAILLELTNAIHYEVGEEVLINLEGATLHYVNEELRVKNLSAVNVSTTGRKISITPRSTDLPTIFAQTKYWGPILVEVENVAFFSETNIIGGENIIDDEIVGIKMNVLSSADFYNEEAPAGFAKVISMARMDDEGIVLYPRSMEDLALSVTELKEDFENATSASYDTETLQFKTGAWVLSGGITAGTSADLKFGSQSIRLRGNTISDLRLGILEMQFDVEGVKGIRLSHGIYPASAELANVNPTTLDLEMSVDQGATFEYVTTFTINVNSTVLITEEISLDIPSASQVRFRLKNSSTPFENGNRPRISIDDFTIIH